jgi:hypothetical protein
MGAQQRILFQQQTAAGLAEMTPRPTCNEICQLFIQLDMIFILHEGSTGLGPFEQLAGRNLVPPVVVKVAEFLGAVGRTGVELPRVVTTTAVATAAGVLEQQGGAVRAARMARNLCWNQCSGSGSGSTGSTCFWASWIRIH